MVCRELGAYREEWGVLIFFRSGIPLCNSDDSINLDKITEKTVCLTLDVEHDFGTLLNKPTFFGLNNIPVLVDLLKDKDIPLTCFIQGSLLDKYPDEISYFNNVDVEFEPHSYHHPHPNSMNFSIEIQKSKGAYKNFFARNPVGYRSPDGYINSPDYFEQLINSGFYYDSSVFPSFRPHRFNNLLSEIEPYYLNNKKIIEFPFSVVSKTIRIPISLSYIKLLGSPYFSLLKLKSLPRLIVFDFHLHDLTQLPSVNEIFSQNILSFFEARIYKKIYHDKGDTGISLFIDTVRMFEKAGYKFAKLEDIYRALTA